MNQHPQMTEYLAAARWFAGKGQDYDVVDVQRVAIATAERPIESAFALLPQNLRTPLPSVIARQEPASLLGMLLLRSVKWTTFFEHKHTTALEQATVILRHLLGSFFLISEFNLPC